MVRSLLALSAQGSFKFTAKAGLKSLSPHLNTVLITTHNSFNDKLFCRKKNMKRIKRQAYHGLENIPPKFATNQLNLRRVFQASRRSAV